MKLPKQATGVRYLNSTDYNTRITITQPNSGNAADGTPLPPTTIATPWANVALWRGKQEDKKESVQGVTSYKVTIRYPKTFNLDTGCVIKVREQILNIDSFADIDGQRVELTIWCRAENPTVVN